MPALLGGQALRDTARAMSEGTEGLAAYGADRPPVVRILLSMPFLLDPLAAYVARLPRGSIWRTRLLKTIMRQTMDALSRNEPDVVMRAYESDADLDLHGAAGLGLAEQYSGQEGWIRLLHDMHENFGEPRFTVTRALDGGDRLVLEVEWVARGKASGVEVVMFIGTVYYLSPRGKIARQAMYWQPDGWNLALEAAGLSE